MRVTDRFVFFWKSGDFLSQWYLSAFAEDDRIFNCAEQYMMFHKARLFGDTATASAIMIEPDPSKQKALGRTVNGFCSDEWDRVCFDVVVSGNMRKFSQNKELARHLLSTGGRLIAEASPYDLKWGIGLRDDDPAAEYPQEWPGKNLLGLALMEVRRRLQ